MKDKSIKDTQISRRGVLPLLGGALLLPFLGYASTNDDDDDAYQTLIKPDGTPVRVKTNTIKSSKIVKEKISNKSLFNWLKK